VYSFGNNGAVSSSLRENIAKNRILLMSTQRTSISVVDDDPVMLKAIARFLSVSGFDVAMFSSAEGFLADANASNAACLVLDINLGGMSGLELQRKLTRSGSTLPIIFITALDDEFTRNEAISAGCIALLRKPFPSHMLIDAIEKAGSQT
jgi:FixJ family two-component response regulator